MGSPTPADISHKQTIHPRHKGTSRREGRKIVRNRRPGCLLGDSVFYVWQKSRSHEISTIWFPQQDQHKGNASWHTTIDKGNSHSPIPRIRAVGRQWLPKERKINLQQGGAPMYFGEFQVINPGHTYIWTKLKGLSRFYVHMCIDLDMIEAGNYGYVHVYSNNN